MTERNMNELEQQRLSLAGQVFKDYSNVILAGHRKYWMKFSMSD